MTDTLHQPELQQRTLRLYGELLCRRESWAGQLVLAAFVGASGSGLAAAASLAGAASITVDSDGAAMKVHFRDGAFDFLVNTLDEALRTIKNQVRLGRPIAIGLMAEPSEAIAEASERGLVAALILSESPGLSAAERAVMVVSGASVDVGASASDELKEWLLRRGWSAAESSADSFAKDSIRQRWWKDLPTHQRSVRGSSRWVWLSDGEQAANSG